MHRGATREWKTPDKLRAAQLLAQHCGWDESTKISLEAGDTLPLFIGGLCRSRAHLECRRHWIRSGFSRLRDPVWRISNLYAIRTRDGKVVPLRPRPQQLQVPQMAGRLERACYEVIASREQVTFDLGGSATTTEFAQSICSKL